MIGEIITKQRNIAKHLTALLKSGFSF